MPSPRIVVNADDLGLSPAVNRAILEGLDAGWLSDASVIVTGPAFAELRPLLAGRSLGLHVDVSEFASLTGPLHGRRGLDFPISAVGDLVTEISAQCERLLDAGLTVSHVDSHQHAHYQPVVFEALLRAAARYRIPYARGISNVPPTRFRRQVRRRLSTERARYSGIGTLAAFGPAAMIQVALDAGWRPDTLEVMCHPGHYQPKYEDEIRWLQTRPFHLIGGSVVAYSAFRTR